MNQPPKQYADYPALVSGDVIELLQRQATEFPEFLNAIADKSDYAYAPGKWTIKEMTGHIIDTERILVYRLTAIARGEKQAIPGFDEDAYVIHAHFKDRSLLSFSEEFSLMRKSHMYLFRSLTEEELERTGTASEKEVSARRLLLTIAGHLTHHISIIKERYL